VFIQGNPENPYEYNITLNNVNIATTYGFAIRIEEGAIVNLTFTGRNKTKSRLNYDLMNMGTLRINGKDPLGSTYINGCISGTMYPNKGGDLIIESGTFAIGGIISADHITINGGRLQIRSERPIRDYKTLTITVGDISAEDIDDVLDHPIGNVTITGGTINGVSYDNEEISKNAKTYH
jgi:cytoskeletal protein CcmA (bactofilin family)